jgi:RND family efflux transporter MFP subunit
MMHKIPKPFPFSLAFLALAAGITFLPACSKKTPPEAPPRAVKLLTVGSGLANGNLGATFAGEVHARIETSLSFRVGGKLQSRSAQLGQSVKAGQVLAQLDPADYRLAEQAAAAQVQAADTARNLAAADLQRFEELRKQGFISGAQLEKLQAQLKANDAQLQQAKAQAQVQGHQVQYGSLTADHAGIITAVLAEPGQVLGAGQPVVQLAQDGPRDVVFALPEGSQKSLPVGTTVRIGSWTANSNEAEQSWAARVREVAASADPVTRTFTVKLDIDAPQAQAPALGSTVRIYPPEKSDKPSITLPLSAIKRESQGSIVWVFDAKAGQVKMRGVQTGAIVGNAVAIEKGLQAGEQVVAAGVHTLTDGQKVTPYEGKPAAKDTAASGS